MAEQTSYRAKIEPVPAGIDRPIWSVMIPTYNCADYLRETLQSVLMQAPSPELMQIEVVDDYSTEDDPAKVVEEMGQGRVNFYRQPKNVGHSKNFNTCLQRSKGTLVHLLHGDDHVLNGFYTKMEQAFDHHPEVGAAFCRQIYMDEQGHWQNISELLQSQSSILENWLERIVVRQYIQAPSIVVRRDVYENLGGFDSRFIYYYEDWEMWVRIATSYPVWYEVEPLIAYRMRSASNTGKSVRTGENMQDVRRGLEIAASYLSNYLSPEMTAKLISQNREYSAICALKNACQLLSVGDTSSGLTQMREAFKCSLSPKVVFYLGAALLRTAIRQFIAA